MKALKTFLLWDRFLSCWLPPEKVTGDKEKDVAEALRITYTYDLPDGKTRQGTFSQKGGLSGIVITEAETRVASRIPPHSTRRGSAWNEEAATAGLTPPRPLSPDWLTYFGALPGKEVTAFLKREIRDLVASPRPHVIIKTGRSPLALEEISMGDGTVVIVNEPGRTTSTDAVRVHRARRALRVLGSVDRGLTIRKLLRERSTATDGDTDDVDRKLRDMIRKLGTTPETFFEAVDLLEGTSRQELDLVAGSP